MGLKRNPKIMAKKIFIKTLGCQMNEYDSNRIYDTVQTQFFELCHINDLNHIHSFGTQKF